jgi:hypothetical protein
MLLRESIAANSHEGKFLFRLGQYTVRLSRKAKKSFFSSKFLSAKATFPHLFNRWKNLSQNGRGFRGTSFFELGKERR